MKIDMSGDEIKLYDFNAHEAFRIAKRMESEGISLYRKALENIRDEGAKHVLEKLLEEEIEHEKYFSGKVNETGGDGEGETDLLEIAGMSVISELRGADLGKLLSDRLEVVKLGLIIESRAGEFYRSLLENTSDKEGRAALEEIIAEEEKHADKLRMLL